MYPPGAEIQKIDVRETADKKLVLVTTKWPERVAINPFLIMGSSRMQYIDRDTSRLGIALDNARAEYRRVGSDGHHFPVYDLVRAEVGGVPQAVDEKPRHIPGSIPWSQMVIENVEGVPDEPDVDESLLPFAAPPTVVAPSTPRPPRLAPPAQLMPANEMGVKVFPPMPAPPAAAMMSSPPAPRPWWRRILHKIFG